MPENTVRKWGQEKCSAMRDEGTEKGGGQRESKMHLHRKEKLLCNFVGGKQVVNLSHSLSSQFYSKRSLISKGLELDIPSNQ